MTRTEFLHARYAEIIDTARNAIRFSDAYDDEPSDDGDEWDWFETGVSTTEHGRPIAEVSHPYEPDWIAAHIAQHDPAYVLNDIGSKQQIVDDLEATLTGWPGHDQAANTVLRSLAIPFATHPDFDEAWRP